MRRKPKTESRQRNNRSLNTVGVPASAHPTDHRFDPRSLLFAATFAFPKPAGRIERVSAILCLICELIKKEISAHFLKEARLAQT